MLQAIKLTFGSVWGWLGIIVGAISLINLGVMYFEVGIGPVLERIVATYKAIVHTGFDYLFFWADWKMPPWAKDVGALYIVFGSANLRADATVEKMFGSLPSGRFSAIITFVSWPNALYDSSKGVFRSIRGIPDPVVDNRKMDYATFLNFVAVPIAATMAITLEAGL